MERLHNGSSSFPSHNNSIKYLILLPRLFRNTCLLEMVGGHTYVEVEGNSKHFSGK